MSEKNDHLLERLKGARKTRRLTQAQFAELLGITRTYYCELENGTRPMPRWMELHVQQLELEPEEVRESEKNDTVWPEDDLAGEWEAVEKELQGLQKRVSRLIGRLHAERKTPPPRRPGPGLF